MFRCQTIALVALILFGRLDSSPGAESGRKVLRGHVPAAGSQFTPKGRLPGTDELPLAIGVPLRDPAGLDQFLADVYSPASAHYRHFLTPEEFAARFSATEADYAAVRNFALAKGFKITGEHSNRQVLDVAGSVANIEQAFQIKLNRYDHPDEPREFFAPDAEPTVDSALPILHVSGLDNFSRPRPNSRIERAVAIPGAVPNAGSGTSGSYMGGDFRAAYVPGVSLTGTGQNVALLQFDGYVSNDIAAYISQAGLTGYPISITNVPVNGGVSIPGAGNGEVCLDIEMVIAMAPGVSKIYVYEAPNGSTAWSTILSRIANDNLAKQISCSWGGGASDPAVDGIFKQMAAQGQSFFCASGDYDAYTTSIPFLLDNTNITLVGGTVLSTASAGGAYVSETVWNDRTVNPNGGNWGSSGGVSPTYAIPNWQQGISMTANLGSTARRNLPDVALTGKNVFIIADTNKQEIASGTSCAAPLWAGFMALVNQQAASIGNPPAGFINPAIYAIGKGLNPNFGYATCFHDIMTGDNSWSGSSGNYPAVAGFDLCTGWGTPNGQTLINALAGTADSLGVAPAIGFSSSGLAGGPFSPASQIFTLTNSDVASFDWSVINTSAWLNVSSSSGTLAPAGQTTVIISLNSVANGFAPGNYTATVGFSNQTSGVLQSRQFTIQIIDSLLLLTTNGFTAAGAVGGPFNPGSQAVVFTNLSASAVAWSLINTSAWLSVSASSGTLGGNSSVSVTVATNASMATLSSNIYTATLVLSNQSSHLTQSLLFSIAVGQNIVQNGGFETGDFTRWALSGGSSSFAVSSSTSYVHSGAYGLKATANSLGYITQNLPTVPGQTYQLSFWFLVSSTRTGQSFQANWNGSTVYSTTAPPTTWNNQKFIVTATSTNTPLQFGLNSASSFSRSFALDDISVTPVNLPAIPQPPISQTGLAGGNVTFTAAAAGTPPLAYQWRTNGINLANGSGVSGATTNVLNLTGITPANSGNYTLVVTNAYGSITSSVATLTVVLPPTITASSISNRTSECGVNTNIFSITAAGTSPLSIQWNLDGSPVTDATNSSFGLTNLTSSSHAVAVTVNNLYGSATSNAVLNVVDTRSPVITLNSTNPFYIELGGVYTEPGAAAYDLCAGLMAVNIAGPVNTGAISTNTVTYTATDGSGNTNTATRTVMVRDTTPPVILWSFTNLVVAADTNCSAVMPDVTGTNFVNATDLSGVLTITQSPTNNAILQLGTNAVVITVADGSGNKTYSTNRVIVRDQTPPVIVLNGFNPLTNELGAAFVDPGVSASDTCTGLALLTTNGTVNVNALGTNLLTYTAVDGSGNTNTAMRMVIVRDTTPPTILWSFTNLVVAADTNCSAVMPDVTGTNCIRAVDFSGALTIFQSPTNAAVLSLGTNPVVIIINDASGNAAYSTNRIVVRDQTPPVITLNGSNPLYLDLGSTFTDPGATAVDTCAGVVPVSVSGTVNTNTAGTNQLSYTANDGSGNTNMASRTVIVRDPVPIISGVVLAGNGGVTLQLGGTPGRQYILEITGELYPATWLPAATNTLDASGTWQFTDLQATNFMLRFYRLKRAP